MPRQIIDTEVSRPRYVRRLIVTWALLLFGLAVLVAVALVLRGHPVHFPGK